MKKIFTLLLLILPLVTACVSDPTSSIPSAVPDSLQSCVYVLCEGVWGQNNSRLDMIDYSRDTVYKDVYAGSGSGNLGDLADCFVRKGDTAFIAMTTAGIIRAIDMRTSKLIGEIKYGNNPGPRKIAIMSRERAFVTNLYDSSVTEFNPETFSASASSVRIGPAPEGIAYCSEYLFAANSGYGDYFANKPKAGTISVINPATNEEIKTLDCGANPIEVIADAKRSKVYAAYYNLPSRKDTVGGIVEYDAVTLRETGRLICSARALTVAGDYLYYLSDFGVSRIALGNTAFKSEDIISNPVKTQFWYSLAVSPKDGSIWIGNAKTYSVEGEIMVFASDNFSAPRKRYATGINPNSIVFIR